VCILTNLRAFATMEHFDGTLISSPTVTTSLSRTAMDHTRHRFQTKMSLCMTAGVVLVLGVLSLHAAYLQDDAHPTTSTTMRFLQDNNNNNNVQDDSSSYKSYSCNDLFTIAPNTGSDEQCQFARECNGGDGVWLPFVFCQKFGLGTMAWCGILSPFVLVWLVLMFRLLGSTAEDYFSPSLEYFSLKAKLPPRYVKGQNVLGTCVVNFRELLFRKIDAIIQDY